MALYTLKTKFTVLFIFLFSMIMTAQTILEPGDLAIVGVNADNQDCGSGVEGDLISFVCFKPILPNTQIDMTDNGWERLLAGKWGNSEAFIRATRTGDTIPAGTVITFSLPATGDGYASITPDNQWSFEKLHTSDQSLNMNSGGDQLYFLQGGSWFDGTSTGFSHDADYVSGKILFGFNTMPDWTPFLNDSINSGLHPDVIPCFHMEPSADTSDYLSYAGPTEPATQLEWINRIGNPDNWQSFDSCAAYQAPPPSFELAPSGISLSCTTCTGCSPVEETITFNLPASSGPYTVTYTIGQDTFTELSITDQATRSVQVDTTTTFALVSVTDAMGCPVFSNFEGGFTTEILAAPPSGTISSLTSCADENGFGLYNLTLVDTLINGGTDFEVIWFTDAGATDTIADPTAFNTANTSVFAQVADAECVSAPLEVPLQIASAPSVDFSRSGDACDTTCRTVNLFFTGSAPYRLVYEVQLLNDQRTRQDTIIIPSDTFSLELCFTDAPVGTINLLELEDTNCATSLQGQSIPVFNGGPSVTNISQILCEGQNLVVNGTVYNQTKASGQEIIPGGARSGCDSIINVSLSFRPLILGSMTGDATICPGGTAFLNFSLSGAERYTVTVVDSRNDTIRIPNIRNGYRHAVQPESTTTYTLVGFTAVGSNCTVSPGSTVDVEVSSLEVSATSNSFFGGFGISCKGANDGALSATVEGDNAPFNILWNTGDTSPELSNLPAGTYTVQATDAAGCVQESSIVLTEPDSLRANILVNPALCTEQVARISFQSISGGVRPYAYSLNGSAFQSVNTPSSISTASNGISNLEIQDGNGCTILQTVDLGDPEGLTVDLGFDQTIQAGDSTTIRAELNFEPEDLVWENTEKATFNSPLSAIVKPDLTTTYRLQARSAEGCMVSDVVTVFVEQNEQFYAPTGFSPNDDGLNDTFTIFGGNNIERIDRLQIYNRWGLMLYEIENLLPNDQANGWNGRKNGELMPSGIYLYVAEITFSNGKTQMVKGDFLLMR